MIVEKSLFVFITTVCIIEFVINQ